MKFHPSLMMLGVWLFAASAFIVLPFELTHRTLHIDGLLLLMAFIAAFVFGGLLAIIYSPKREFSNLSNIEMGKADLVVQVAAAIGLFAMGYETIRGSGLNLENSFEVRSEQASAILGGIPSQSSSIFKIGFLFYPASYVYLVRSITLDVKPKWLIIAFLGIMPSVLASLAMGGRMPLLAAIIYSVLAYRSRRMIGSRVTTKLKYNKINIKTKIFSVILGMIAFSYFINVFLVRADAMGGAHYILNHAATTWGATFSNAGANLLNSVFGEAATALFFIFSWYLVQGILMSSTLFVQYEGSALLGVYGVDIFTAIARRVDPIWVSRNFNYMLDLEIYGFYPSAFGTLYVDFGYWGLAASLFWGWFCAFTYRKVRRGRDIRWIMVAPFITFGIIVSLVNTPFGFSNGLLTHIWLVIAFLLSKRTIGVNYQPDANQNSNSPKP